MKGEALNKTLNIQSKFYIFSSVEDQESSVPISSPPRAPAPEECQEVNCRHLIIYDQHFDTNKWMLYQRADHHYRQQKQAEDDDDNDEDFIV